MARLISFLPPLCFLLSAFMFNACHSSNDLMCERCQEYHVNNEDSSNWNKDLLRQDKETYTTYQEYLADLPLTLSPFPVADYDWAVGSFPLQFKRDSIQLHGLAVGEFPDPMSDNVKLKMALIFISPDSVITENSFVQSRNYPYLTAMGFVQFSNQKFDWVFADAPDKPGFVMINMKLFDLQFGRTVVIYPLPDGTFFYRQFELDPGNYKDAEAYKNDLVPIVFH